MNTEILDIQYTERLPEDEQRISRYWYIDKMNQKEIARIMGVTQGAISSRLSKIRRRVNFLKSLESWNFSDVEQKLKEILPVFELELIKIFLHTTCQTETARQLNDIFNLQGRQRMNQVKVRHRFNRCRKFLHEKEHEYATLLDLFHRNSLILHNVKLPQFDKEV